MGKFHILFLFSAVAEVSSKLEASESTHCLPRDTGIQFPQTDKIFVLTDQGPLLLTWLNFSPNMDK